MTQKQINNEYESLLKIYARKHDLIIKKIEVDKQPQNKKIL